MLLHIPNPWVHLSGRLLELILPFHEIHMRINGFTTNMNACSEACGLPRHLGQCKDLEATGSSPHWIYQALHISTERDFYCHCYFYLVVRNYLFSLRNVNYITRCCRFFCFVFANEQVKSNWACICICGNDRSTKILQINRKLNIHSPWQSVSGRVPDLDLER